VETVPATEAPKKRRNRRIPPAIDPVTKKFVSTGHNPPPLPPAPAPEPDPLVSAPEPPLGLDEAAIAQIAAYLEAKGMLAPTPKPAPPVVADGKRRLATHPDLASPETPYRLWTAGPNMVRPKIYMEGTSGLRPHRDGAYYLISPAQVAHARRVLGQNRFWPDTVPDGEPDQRCETCGWTSRNYQAMGVHLNQAHGRPQAGP
jgi:hypothetical protein